MKTIENIIHGGTLPATVPYLVHVDGNTAYMADQIQPELWLIWAMNSIVATAKRHQGGALDQADRYAIGIAMLLCQRMLHEGTPPKDECEAEWERVAAYSRGERQ